MADTDKLVSDLAELRKHALALIEGLDSILASHSPPEPEKPPKEDAAYFIDHMVSKLHDEKMPMRDSELIEYVSGAKGVTEPEVQAWKSLGYWMKPNVKNKLVVVVEERDGKWIQVHPKTRTDSLARLRKFPENLVALPEWVGTAIGIEKRKERDEEILREKQKKEGR